MSNNKNLINNSDELYVIDDSGEVVNTIRNGDRILRKESIDSLKNNKEDDTFTIESKFVKLFIDNINLLICQLSNNKNKPNNCAVSLMFYLMQFISYRDGLLQFKNGKPLTTQYIIDNFNMGKSQIYSSINLLKQANIIAITKVKNQEYYVFNPYIACNGSKIDNTTRHIFREDLYQLKIKD